MLLVDTVEEMEPGVRIVTRFHVAPDWSIFEGHFPGAPVLPGAMFLLAYHHKNHVPILGLPGCVMYAKRTIFDLVLPRIMADETLTQDDLAALGHGGLCLSCPVCTFPNCGFGK